MHDVIVLGGGVSGITTALALQSAGFRPAIVTDHVSHGNGGPRPFVPSDYPMASAYPHELRIDGFDKITEDSQAAFSQLHAAPRSGVSKYRMFEVFEHEPPTPHSLARRMNVQIFEGTPDSLKRTIDPPARNGAEHLWGWRFDTYFVDMPVYMRRLWMTFTERGGAVVREHVEELPESAEVPIVNCLGLGAIEVCKDRRKANIMRGLQVMVADAPLVTDSGSTPLCYNYTPTADVYSRADGTPEYVHFFSRSDGWVLGQTREPGKLDADGNWVGDVVPSAKPIVDLNADLLKSWKGLELDATSMKKREGYRYYRDPDGEGVRLEAEDRDGSLVIHNYGHGGSGVTVSWGCAIKCAQMLSDRVSPRGVSSLRSVQARVAWIFGQ